MPTQTDWAYLAGLIDGEGCISGISHRKGSNYSVHVSIVNTDRRMIQWVVDTFGVGNGPNVMNRNKIRKCYRVQINIALQVGWLLRGALPYLVIKKEQAVLAIERVNEVTPQRQGEIFEELKELKRANRTI